MNWDHNYKAYYISLFIPVKMIYSSSESIFIGFWFIFEEEKTTPWLSRLRSGNTRRPEKWLMRQYHNAVAA